MTVFPNGIGNYISQKTTLKDIFLNLNVLKPVILQKLSMGRCLKKFREFFFQFWCFVYHEKSLLIRLKNFVGVLENSPLTGGYCHLKENDKNKKYENMWKHMMKISNKISARRLIIINVKKLISLAIFLVFMNGYLLHRKTLLNVSEI